MKSYYGRIDVHNMPPEDLLHKWKKEARQTYQSDSNVSYERFEIDYVWQQVADWQEARLRESCGRGLE